MQPQQKIDILLQWCNDNDIWIDPRLKVQYDNKAGIRVVSNDLYIPPLTSLVQIHKNSVISTRSCYLSKDITPTLYGHEAQYSLSLALYGELLIERESRWFGYLQSLPNKVIDLPIFWEYQHSLDQSSRNDEGLIWLRGTEVERSLQRETGNSLKAITEYYVNVAEPMLHRHFSLRGNEINRVPTLDGFYYAYSLVSSRAFFVDAYHGLSMVPIGDAFNHAQDNHVHLQSEFNVCPECGSLQECIHDRIDSSMGNILPKPPQKDAPLSAGKKDLDDYYEMVSNTVIPPHVEVFNTYGETLTNTQLLVQYGFILDGNENDFLSWAPGEVYSYISENNQHGIPELQSLLRAWSYVTQNAAHDLMLERISESHLVYFQQQDSTAGDLCVNGDGKISHQLWLFLTLPLINWGNSDYENGVSKALVDLIDLQISLEAISQISGDEGDTLPDGLVEGTSALVLTSLAQSVIKLCVGQKHQLGKEGASSLNLGDIIDTLPVDMERTRHAISIVMSEKSILDSCESAWVDILATLIP